MKKEINYIFISAVFLILLILPVEALSQGNYNDGRNYSYIRYYKERAFNNTKDDKISFSKEIRKNRMSKNKYYYAVEYGLNREIKSVSCIYNDYTIFKYEIPKTDMYSAEEFYYPNSIKTVHYFNSEGKPVLIKKYRRDSIISIIRYDTNGNRRITEVYDNNIIQSVSYTNSDNTPVFKQTYLYPYLYTTEMYIYESEVSYKNIIIYENENARTESVYVSGKKEIVYKYVEDYLYKIYYYDSDELLYKYEIYNENGDIIYEYNKNDSIFGDSESDEDTDRGNEKESGSDTEK